MEQAALGTDEVARNVAGVREAAVQAEAEAGTLSQTSVELSDQAPSFIHRIREA